MNQALSPWRLAQLPSRIRLACNTSLQEADSWAETTDQVPAFFWLRLWPRPIARSTDTTGYERNDLREDSEPILWLSGILFPRRPSPSHMQPAGRPDRHGHLPQCHQFRGPAARRTSQEEMPEEEAVHRKYPEDYRCRPAQHMLRQREDRLRLLASNMKFPSGYHRETTYLHGRSPSDKGDMPRGFRLDGVRGIYLRPGSGAGGGYRRCGEQAPPAARRCLRVSGCSVHPTVGHRSQHPQGPPGQ